MKKYRVVFFGTPKIASKCLETLIHLGLDVQAVITKPDRPVGRKREIVFCDVKKTAIENKIKIFQPDAVAEIVDEIVNISPDVIFTCAYGKIIPKEIFSMPEFGCINIHTSLLPKYRGGAPIHWSIINGEKTTGVTFMYTEEKLDTGKIIFQNAIDVAPDETYQSLYKKLTLLSQEMIKENIHNIFEKKITPTPQDESEATYAKNITRQDEKINWHQTAKEIDCLIRGLFDSPGAFSIYNGMSIKILKAKINTNVHRNDEPGKILEITNEGIVVSTKKDSVVIEKIQMPSKTPVLFKDIINGNHGFKIGDFFK